MAYTSSKTLSFEEFITQYRDNPRYELADGELIDMEPTGPHETLRVRSRLRRSHCCRRVSLRRQVALETLLQRCLTVSGKLATKIGIALVTEKLPWFIPRTCLIRPFTDAATARRPDIVVLDETVLSSEPWEQEPVITLGRSIKLVVEVVSTNWETDYARKVEEYALLGIPEYWIADYRGLGGIAFIGKPKQPTFTVCQLIGEEYTQQQYRLGQPIHSPLLPNLQLCLNDILPR